MTPRKNEDWSKYEKCPICGAITGWPCVDQRLSYESLRANTLLSGSGAKNSKKNIVNAHPKRKLLPKFRK